MKCTYGPAYQWLNEDGSWGVGVIVVSERGEWIARVGALLPKDVLHTDEVLIADFYTRELEFVEFDKLSPYPPDGKPIEEPSK
jgi:hypothetical protein